MARSGRKQTDVCLPVRNCDLPPEVSRAALGRSCVTAAHDGRRRAGFAHCCARGGFSQPRTVGRPCATAVPARLRLAQSAVRAGGGARGTALTGGWGSAPGIPPGSPWKAGKPSPLGSLLPQFRDAGLQRGVRKGLSAGAVGRGFRMPARRECREAESGRCRRPLRPGLPRLPRSDAWGRRRVLGCESIGSRASPAFQMEYRRFPLVKEKATDESPWAGPQRAPDSWPHSL